MYGDSVDYTVEENSRLLQILNTLVAVNKGMQAVRLCTNKILQYLLEVPANAG